MFNDINTVYNLVASNLKSLMADFVEETKWEIYLDAGMGCPITWRITINDEDYENEADVRISTYFRPDIDEMECTLEIDTEEGTNLVRYATDYGVLCNYCRKWVHTSYPVDEDDVEDIRDVMKYHWENCSAYQSQLDDEELLRDQKLIVVDDELLNKPLLPL